MSRFNAATGVAAVSGHGMPPQPTDAISHNGRHIGIVLLSYGQNGHENSTAIVFSAFAIYRTESYLMPRLQNTPNGR